jgi:hypothetical protein
MTMFTVHMSTGASTKVEARGFNDVAAKLRVGKELPRDKKVVVGIESPTGQSRFFLKREEGTVLFPISARVAELETHL